MSLALAAGTAAFGCCWLVLPGFAVFQSARTFHLLLSAPALLAPAAPLPLGSWLWAQLRLRTAAQLWLIAEALFLGTFLVRRQLDVDDGPGGPASGKLTDEARAALLARVLDATPDHEQLLAGWFHNCSFADIRRGNLAEWAAWAFFQAEPAGLSPAEQEALEGVIATVEGRWGCSFAPGYDSRVRSIRLPYDRLSSVHRPLFIYAAINCVLTVIHRRVRRVGFSWHEPAAGGLGFWHRPRLRWAGAPGAPLVFLHGIGAGGAPAGLAIARRFPDSEIFLPNLPHISYRLWPGPVLTVASTVDAIEAMLAAHAAAALAAHGGAIFVGHSFGTAVLSWVLQKRPSLARGALFLDPICFMLHHPALASNFLYRSPATLSELALWAGVGSEYWVNRYLHRHFGPTWHETSLALDQLPRELWDAGRVAVVLGEEDSVIDAGIVHGYLTGAGLTPDPGAPLHSYRHFHADGRLPTFGEAVQSVESPLAAPRGFFDVRETAEAEAVGWGELIWIPGADHGMWANNPAVVNQLEAMVHQWCAPADAPQQAVAEAAAVAKLPSWAQGIAGLDLTT
jgi:hypothetical protein